MSDDAGHKLLIEALEKREARKDASEVKAILAAHPDIDFTKGEGEHQDVLHAAIATSNADCVQAVLEAGAKAEALPEKDWGTTPLYFAVECPGNRVNPRIIALLLKHGAKPDTCPDEDSDHKPLIEAVKNGYESVVTMLLEAGADIKQTDRHGSPLVSFAANGGYSGVLRILADEGANLDQLDWLNKTPLEIALWEGHREAFETLMALGADPRAKSEMKSTLLMAAASGGETGLFERLIQMGCDVNARNANGDTALHYATWTGRGESVKMLLDLGARSDIENNDGETARAVAEREGHIHITRSMDARNETLGQNMKQGLDAGIGIYRPLRFSLAAR